MILTKGPASHAHARIESVMNPTVGSVCLLGSKAYFTSHMGPASSHKHFLLFLNCMQVFKKDSTNYIRC